MRWDDCVWRGCFISKIPCILQSARWKEGVTTTMGGAAHGASITSVKCRVAAPITANAALFAPVSILMPTSPVELACVRTADISSDSVTHLFVLKLLLSFEIQGISNHRSSNTISKHFRKCIDGGGRERNANVNLPYFFDRFFQCISIIREHRCEQWAIRRYSCKTFPERCILSVTILSLSLYVQLCHQNSF